MEQLAADGMLYREALWISALSVLLPILIALFVAVCLHSTMPTDAVDDDSDNNQKERSDNYESD